MITLPKSRFGSQIGCSTMCEPTIIKKIGVNPAWGNLCPIGSIVYTHSLVGSILVAIVFCPDMVPKATHLSDDGLGPKSRGCRCQSELKMCLLVDDRNMQSPDHFIQRVASPMSAYAVDGTATTRASTAGHYRGARMRARPVRLQ